MELDLTDEQRMLADSVKGLLDKRYDANARLQLLESDDGWSRELWKQYAELGLLGLPFDEQYGGAGMGAGELAVVMEAFGRALVLEPYVATVVLGGRLVAARRLAGAEGRAAARRRRRLDAARVRRDRELVALVAHRHRVLGDAGGRAAGCWTARRSLCSAATSPTTSS